MIKVDLNSDLGERSGACRPETDEAVIAQVSSVNIACGFHAGSPLIMEATVAAAKAAGAAVGAHPGFADRAGFGRQEMHLPPMELKALVKYQLGALMAFTAAAGIPLQHCKPHGALYNMAAKDPVLARAIAEAIAEVDDTIILLALAGSQMINAGKAIGLRTAGEVFADRAYCSDGTLVPRNMPGAVITDVGEAVKRTLRMVKEGKVTAITGEDIAIRADSICVHGDNPAAVAFTETIRRCLTAEGIEIAPLSVVLA